jgi:hypothetical protein
MGDELWFYHSGCDQIHEDYEGIDCAVGLAKLRPGRYVAADINQEIGDGRLNQAPA